MASKIQKLMLEGMDELIEAETKETEKALYKRNLFGLGDYKFGWLLDAADKIEAYRDRITINGGEIVLYHRDGGFSAYYICPECGATVWCGSLRDSVTFVKNSKHGCPGNANHYGSN